MQLICGKSVVKKVMYRRRKKNGFRNNSKNRFNE
jgi:hypothetical protein